MLGTLRDKLHSLTFARLVRAALIGQFPLYSLPGIVRRSWRLTSDIDPALCFARD
jgi:hypothetical protein